MPFSCATSSICSGLQHLRAQRDALNRIGTCYGGGGGGQENRRRNANLLSMIASIVRSLQLAGMLAHGGVDGAGDSALERLARVMICPASMPLSCWRRCLSLS